MCAPRWLEPVYSAAQANARGVRERRTRPPGIVAGAVEPKDSGSPSQHL